MNLSADDLAQCWAIDMPKASLWVDALNPVFDLFSINTTSRVIDFLTQTGYESGCGRWVRELWGPTMAQLGYEGRADLGNVRPGDGRKYLGRGLIQITGRSNYVAVRNGLGRTMSFVPDFEASPELLELPRWASYSAGWFWRDRGLNELSDTGNQEAMRRRINGGDNGLSACETMHASISSSLSGEA